MQHIKKDIEEMDYLEFEQIEKSGNFEILNEDKFKSWFNDMKEKSMKNQLSEGDMKLAGIDFHSFRQVKVNSPLSASRTYFIREAQVEWESNGSGEIMKARAGTYKDTPVNRKKGIVGQKYGKMPQDDEIRDKPKAKNPDRLSGTERRDYKDELKRLQGYKKTQNTSEYDSRIEELEDILEKDEWAGKEYLNNKWGDIKRTVNKSIPSFRSMNSSPLKKSQENQISDDIEKSQRGAPPGTEKTWGGKVYVKRADGKWRPKKKGGEKPKDETVKQNPLKRNVDLVSWTSIGTGDSITTDDGKQYEVRQTNDKLRKVEAYSFSEKKEILLDPKTIKEVNGREFNKNSSIPMTDFTKKPPHATKPEKKQNKLTFEGYLNTDSIKDSNDKTWKKGQSVKISSDYSGPIEGSGQTAKIVNFKDEDTLVLELQNGKRVKFSTDVVEPIKSPLKKKVLNTENRDSYGNKYTGGLHFEDLKPGDKVGLATGHDYDLVSIDKEKKTIKVESERGRIFEVPENQISVVNGNKLYDPDKHLSPSQKEKLENKLR